jgi:hypothetical protein
MAWLWMPSVIWLNSGCGLDNVFFDINILPLKMVLSLDSIQMLFK